MPEQRPRHEEIRHHYEDLLDEIKQGTVTLGSLVLENTRRAVEALLANDLAAAQAVVDADAEIDELYVRLERMTFETLARQQPVAGDLRLLVSITRVLYELERSGDLAVNCAKGLQWEEGLDLPPELSGVLRRLGHEAAALFSRGIDALADMDETAGDVLDRDDDVVDDTVSEFYSEIARSSDRIGLQGSIQLSRIGRYLERIADHAVNVAQHVTYIVTGSFPGDLHAAD